MNIAELYQQTPVERHPDIKTIGAQVYVKGTDGMVDQYLLGDDGELWLVRSDRPFKQDLEAIKGALGI